LPQINRNPPKHGSAHDQFFIANEQLHFEHQRCMQLGLSGASRGTLILMNAKASLYFQDAQSVDWVSVSHATTAAGHADQLVYAKLLPTPHNTQVTSAAYVHKNKAPGDKNP